MWATSSSSASSAASCFYTIYLCASSSRNRPKTGKGSGGSRCRPPSQEGRGSRLPQREQPPGRRRERQRGCHRMAAEAQESGRLPRTAAAAWHRGRGGLWALASLWVLLHLRSEPVTRRLRVLHIWRLSELRASDVKGPTALCNNSWCSSP